MSCPCLYPQQSCLLKTTTRPCRGHFLLWFNLHSFHLMVTLLQFSFEAAVYVCSVAHLCLSLCYPTDCSPPGSSVHGLFQASILEQVGVSYSRGSSQPRDWTHVSYVSCIGRQILHHCRHLGSPWSSRRRARPSHSLISLCRPSDSFKQTGHAMQVSEMKQCWD